MSHMHFWDAHWDLRVAECPCDVHFTRFLEARDIRGSTIFHFGTGGHHHLGYAIHEAGSDNAVLGITASPSEYENYVKLAIEKPEIARFYKVFFGDIYQMDKRLLPTFDWVTLFHMCEFRNEKNDAYAAMTDREVIELFMETLAPQGQLIFYEGSFAWPNARNIVEALEKEGLLKFVERFENLLFYKRA